MKKMTTAEIRESFLKFFESKGCAREVSSSLVPINDPTLLFTAAGMVQFKDVFLGNEKRAYTRATTAQKCLRAGGKHNDLENVGFTSRHHTFFEMLGNFSFGDYFKKEAIHWAWELVTEVFKLPKERLYVTVYKDDDEAYDIWHKEIGVPENHIFRFGEKDNFWSAGDVGPCGPCTEIFFDRGAAYNTGDPEMDRMGGDGDRFLEFYNLVFMQYNRDASGNLSPLPKPSVDTGMGLERISSILQDVATNYDIDLFREIFSSIESLSGKKYQPGANETSIAMRVIADHLRAVSFLIADGVMPSNEGRGYVLRRILRRAVRYGKNLGFNTSFMEKLVPALVKAMGSAYPELKEKQSLIREAIKAEEEKFFQTLEKGLDILQGELKKLNKGGELPGDVAFLLYDSFGFPVDLTRLIAEEHGYSVNESGFETAMEKQRTQSRGDKKDQATSGDFALYQSLAKTMKPMQFLGYELCQADGNLVAIIEGGKSVKSAKAKDKPLEVTLIFDSTPFYGESGGQMGDSGDILQNGILTAKVRDVKKPLPEFHTITAMLEPGLSLSVGQKYTQRVSETLRKKIAANHSATHLLHWALHKILGNHVKQAGSLVTHEFLRFDFTHFRAMTGEELSQVETLINSHIASGEPVETKLMDKDQAVAAGAVALFGEKYDDEVRVVSIGDGFSTELCGGTHVKNTTEIRTFLITSESGVAAGVRRIIALTSSAAVEHLKAKASITDLLQERLKATSMEEIVARVERMQLREKELEKKLAAIQEESAGAVAQDIVSRAKKVGAISVVAHSLADSTSGFLRSVCERSRDLMPSGVIALAAHDAAENKVFLIVSVSSDLTKTVQAGKLVQGAAPHFGGKGGGKPELAQAGGTKPEGIDAALNYIVSSLGNS